MIAHNCNSLPTPTLPAEITSNDLTAPQTKALKNAIAFGHQPYAQAHPLVLLLLNPQSRLNFFAIRSVGAMWSSLLFWS
jgi:hypothetical protein